MLSRIKASVFWILVVLSTILVVSPRTQVMAEPTLETIVTATLGSAIDPYIYATPCARAQNTLSWYQTGTSGINLIFAGSEGVPPEDPMGLHASATGVFDLLILSPDGTVGYLPLLQPDRDYPPIKLWSDDSYWYMKIKENPKIHPNNDAMISWLYDYGGNNQKHPNINYKSWTGVIYDAYEDTPLYSVLEKDAGQYHNVPVPDPYPIDIPDDDDASVTIIDWYRGDIWASWAWEAVGGTYEAGDLYAFELNSSGVVSYETVGWTCGGSGCPAAAYRIKPEEIEAGVIYHPVACCLHSVGPYTDGSRIDGTEGFVAPPAAHTDRETTSSNPNQIPAGARIQLDPAIDLDSLGLTRTGKIIAKCMQDYGIVVVESGGSWAIYAEHTLTAQWSTNPSSTRYMAGGLLSPIDSLWTASYIPWRVIDFDLMPTVDDLSEYE